MLCTTEGVSLWANEIDVVFQEEESNSAEIDVCNSEESVDVIEDEMPVNGQGEISDSINLKSTQRNTNENTVFSVDSTDARPGEIIVLPVTVKNNIGILGATLQLSYGDSLELLEAEQGDALDYLTFQVPGVFTSPCRFLWDGQNCTEDDANDGIIMNLKFKVLENAIPGEKIDIKISANREDVFDNDTVPINTEFQNGYVLVCSYRPGDVNNDGKINSTDIVLIRRYIVGGYNVEIEEKAADVNDDLTVNAADVTLIRRYIAGGYGVKLEPQTKIRCEHEKDHVEQHEATCTTEGNTEYWYCSECNRYFSDEAGRNELFQNDITIPMIPHKEVIDPAVEPTDTTPGYTAGSHCEMCGKVLVAQKKIEINYFEIRYDVNNGDEYLKNIDIENNNPSSIASGGTINLSELSTEGYRFLGWYDASEGGNKITKIENADRNYMLYAHWSSLEYTIQFYSDLVSADPITYKSSEGKVLPTLSLDGYTFAGWSDADGKIIKRIIPGTIGNMTLCANWVSDRNQAWAKKKLDKPVIYEDDNVILFAYEIGEVKNVPLSVIEDFGKINENGVALETEKEYEYITSEEMAAKYTKAIEAATTNTSSWTLSKEWSETTHVDEEYCVENGITRSEAETTGKTENDEYFVTNSQGGSETTTVINSTDSYNLTTETQNNTNNSKFGSSEEYNSTYSHELITTDTTANKIGAELSTEFSAPGIKFGGKLNGENSNSHEHGETSGYSDGSMYGETTEREEGGSSGTSSQTGTVSNHTSNTSGTSTWNTESGYKQSTAISHSSTISKEISEKICSKTGYGKNYITGENSSDTQGFVNSEVNKDEYSNVITYSRIKDEKTRIKCVTTNTKTGYHRWVMAGTAHVYGVVGYDIATKSYFVYSFSLMDDEVHRFEDYSYNTASYDDNQNSIIGFNIPYEINDYVNSRVFATEGLEVDVDGTITAYTGEDSYIVIPDYAVVSNKDNGKNAVIKVTGISKNAFRGNDNITGVELSTFTTQIPENAFENCSKLYFINARNISSVGKDAFKGANLLNKWILTSKITSMAPGAFNGAEDVTIDVANADVFKSIIGSQISNMTLDIGNMQGSLDNETITILDSVKKLVINGYDKVFNNLILKCDAEEVTLNRLNLKSLKEIPLQLNSSCVNLYQSHIEADGCCVILNADTTQIDIYGTNILNSNGSTAILCRNGEIIRSTQGLKTVLNLSGDWVCCSRPTGENFLNFAEGNIRIVSRDAFDALRLNHTLTFNANGGTCNETSRQVSYGASFGTLPIPVRTYYTFAGWYSDSGEKVSESTKMGETDVTVNAKWTANPKSDWVLYSEAPKNALITDNNWKYKKRSWITSGSTSVTGYTLDGTKTEAKNVVTNYWSDPGNWTRDYRTPGDKLKIVDQRTGTEKVGDRAVSYHMSSYCYMTNRGKRHYWDDSIDYVGEGYASSYGEHYNETEISVEDLAECESGGNGHYFSDIIYAGTNACDNIGYAVEDMVMFIDGTNYEPVYSNYTEYRYSELKQKTVTEYTYHLYKDEDKESNSEVSESENILNVRRYVRYINP